MSLSTVPTGQFFFMGVTWISSILYVMMVLALLRAVMVPDRKKHTSLRSSYYTLFLIHSVADLSLFLFVEFLMRPRKFNWFGMFSVKMKALAKFCYPTMVVLCTTMYTGHAVIALNRFTVFYAPLKYEMLWSSRNMALAAAFIWMTGLLSAVPAFLILGGDIEFRLLPSGVLQMFGGDFGEYEATQVITCTVVVFSACAFFYGYAFWKAMSTKVATKVERNLLTCAFFSSFPFVIEFGRSVVICYATMTDRTDLFILAAEWCMGKKEDNQLGLLGATSYIVGSIIGSGIFVSPKGILMHAGSVGLSLCIWILCAAMAMLSGINYIEMGTSIPESGAELAYISYVGWDAIAFSFLWLSIIIQSSCSGAVLFLTFGEYIVEALDPITCLTPGTKDIATKLFGFGLLFILTVTNLYALSKFAGRIQIASMFAKIAALVMIIGIGGYFMIFKGDTSHFSGSYLFSGSKWSASQIVLAIYQGNWAYGGYTTLNYGTEDIPIKNLKTTLPRAVIGGLAMSSVVYVLANIAYFSVLTPEQILDSDAVATLFLRETVGVGASYAMPALVGILIIGTLNGDIFSWSRYMLAGARRSMMPTAFSLIHPKNDSPRVAVLSHTLLCVGFSFIGPVDTLVNYLTVTGIMCTMFALAALILIKWKRIPVAKDAVKFHIFWPILNLLIQLALLVIPWIDDPVTSAVGFGAFMIGLAAYFVFMWPKKLPNFLHTIDRFVTIFCQKAFWTIVDTGPEYQKESASGSIATVSDSTATQDTFTRF